MTTAAMTDRRRTCWCGHRYRDHATGGLQCLAVYDDPDKSALAPCTCHRWEPVSSADQKWLLEHGLRVRRVNEMESCTCGLAAAGYRASWAVQHTDDCPANEFVR